MDGVGEIGELISLGARLTCTDCALHLRRYIVEHLALGIYILYMEIHKHRLNCILPRFIMPVTAACNCSERAKL